MSTLERAITIANTAHSRQMDKTGAPYILHPLRVLDRVRAMGGGEVEMIAAVLHDVVEDSEWTLEQLREEGFGEDVIRVVAALTKRPDEEIPDDRKWDLTPYYRFVERAAQSRASRMVKRGDLLDNLDTTRIANRGLKDDKRIVRYCRGRGLLETIIREHGDDIATAPTILPLRNRIALHKVEASCPGDRPILVCDFHVEHAEQGTREPGGIRLGDRVFAVDHHAQLEPFFSRGVTSTSLAHEYVARVGVERTRASWVVINHTDCDSILSSAVLLGHLEPDQALVDASIAADHTGDANVVADLLQGLDEARRGRRTEAQYFESLRNVQRLLAGEALEPAARQALELRQLRRELARQFVDSGRLQVQDGVAWGTLDQEIDGAFIPALVPGAAVVLLFVRHPRHPDRWAAKLRLGLGAPEGVTLHTLGVREFDSQFGGRWNAGSNKRGGGTMLAPDAYAGMIRERLGACETSGRS